MTIIVWTPPLASELKIAPSVFFAVIFVLAYVGLTIWLDVRRAAEAIEGAGNSASIRFERARAPGKRIAGKMAHLHWRGPFGVRRWLGTISSDSSPVLTGPVVRCHCNGVFREEVGVRCTRHLTVRVVRKSDIPQIRTATQTEF